MNSFYMLQLLAGGSGAVAVLLGAYGAHGLPVRMKRVRDSENKKREGAHQQQQQQEREREDDALVRSWQTAAHYQVLAH